MKNFKYTKGLLISLILLSFVGCVTVQDTIYLRQAEVVGPIYTPPIHVTDSIDTPALTVSPKFTMNTKKSFIGEVEQRIGFFNLDTNFIPADHSLIWNVTTVTAGLDLDLQLSNVFAITMGALYSSG
ncbi:MAG: hypothetical protein R3321_12155, partial [Nitrososphaeraceae archaeon]|nr:hypothetical protein [Nitrososphaeraceae archaeon]